MEDSVPKYSSDSFIPFPSSSNSQTNARFNNGTRHKNVSRKHIKSSTSVSSNIPWKTSNFYSCGVIGLHEEINEFYEKMCPTEEETEIRSRVIEHVTRIVHSLWPHAKVEVFGSFRTGLYLPSSDIDMVVIGEWRSLPLSTLSTALQQKGIAESDITIIATANVPIIRIMHTLSRVKVDISFNMTNGVESARMVKKLMKEYPTLPKLVLILKQFLLQRGLNEVYSGGMSSYCLTLLIVSLLQGYHKPKTLPSSNLGTLLLEFFEHYGLNFNHERVSIHFENGGNYQPKYRPNGMLSVEDPLKKGNDIAKGTYLMHHLKLSFENAFLTLHKAVTDSAATNEPLNSYLSLIVQVDESVWKERAWMSQNYQSIIRQLSSLMTVPGPSNEEEIRTPKSKKFGKKKKLNNEEEIRTPKSKKVGKKKKLK